MDVDADAEGGDDDRDEDEDCRDDEVGETLLPGSSWFVFDLDIGLSDRVLLLKDDEGSDVVECDDDPDTAEFSGRALEVISPGRPMLSISFLFFLGIPTFVFSLCLSRTRGTLVFVVMMATDEEVTSPLVQ